MFQTYVMTKWLWVAMIGWDVDFGTVKNELRPQELWDIVTRKNQNNGQFGGHISST